MPLPSIAVCYRTTCSTSSGRQRAATMPTKSSTTTTATHRLVWNAFVVVLHVRMSSMCARVRRMCRQPPQPHLVACDMLMIIYCSQCEFIFVCECVQTCARTKYNIKHTSTRSRRVQRIFCPRSEAILLFRFHHVSNVSL